jgi:hypothetical protein
MRRQASLFSFNGNHDHWVHTLKLRNCLVNVIFYLKTRSKKVLIEHHSVVCELLQKSFHKRYKGPPSTLGHLYYEAYTVIQNFGFSLPKHSVLKNLPKHPIIQLKFRVKSAKHSSQSQYPRSFVFGEIYKFNTKLRDFRRNISDIGQWVICDISHKIYFFSLKSVGRLVRWSPLLTLCPKSPKFKPQTGQKIRTKNFD